MKSKQTMVVKCRIVGSFVDDALKQTVEELPFDSPRRAKANRSKTTANRKRVSPASNGGPRRRQKNRG
jgi:hypothetical protein